ncbi:MAG: trigger factor [Planctomycetes bacterium]|nr:trigger factor [Planctomycetota bacterium]MCP4839888.1 trigger factor [Planctomycetota bacterium]
MSDDNDQYDGYDFKLEEAGPARKRLFITISADAIQGKVDASMGTLQFQSAIPGFRKGKAPKDLLERRFGTAVREETRNELMQEGCRLAFEKLGVKPLGQLEPVDPDAEIVMEIGKSMEFGVEFEVLPDFELPDMSTIEIQRPQLEVNDEHIDEELERQCMRAGTAEELTGKFKTADRLLGRADLYLEDGEEPIFSHEQILAVIPKKGEPGQLLGLMIDGMDSMFAKASVGDTIEISTTGPEGHEREDVRGKDLNIKYTIFLAERVTACTPEDLIERFSLASADVLREQVRLALEQQRDEEQSSVLREQVLKAVTEAVEMELPENLSGQQVASDLEQVRMELMQQGLEASEVESKLAEVRDRSSEQTRSRMKTWFVLERIANENDIQVSEQDINGQIATTAMRQGIRPDKLRAELVKSDRIMPLARSIRERKAAERLVEAAKVTDISLDDWNEKVKKTKAQAAAS